MYSAPAFDSGVTPLDTKVSIALVNSSNVVGTLIPYLSNRSLL